MLLIRLFFSTTLLQLTIIIRRLLFGGIFSTLDDVDSVLCMVFVFELVLSPLFLFGMFGLLVWTGLNTDVLMSLSIVMLDLESGDVILCPTLIIKSRDASIILFPTLIDKSPDPSNELIRLIFYTKVCNIISDTD